MAAQNGRPHLRYNAHMEQQKKKVLVFIPTFPVLSETFIERDVAKLAERNVVDVSILSLNRGKGAASDSLNDKVFYQPLSWLNSLKAIKYFFTKPGKIIDTWTFLGSSPRGFISKLYLFLKSIGYVEVFAKHRPDFILAHFMSEPSTLCLIVSEILEIPLGIFGHAKDITVDAEYVPQKVEKAKFILVCNKNALKHAILLSGKPNPKNMILQYHGIDFEKLRAQFEAAEPIGFKEKDAPVITMVGRLVEKKGHKYLLQASKILKEKGVVHQLVLIGPGPMFEEINTLIERMNLQDTVQIIGEGKGIPFSEILRYYKSTDVCVFSGIRTDSGDEDGLPNTLTEAAVLRVPIVTTKVGSTTDLVENEVSGLVVPQKDPGALAAALERTITDSDLREKITAGAEKKVREIFALDKNIQELERMIGASF